ncbi:MAG: hypothetical protein JWP75_2459 [Frondihabitans sp.]|nr:hypothetical protein [Frondihabitans sp.]
MSSTTSESERVTTTVGRVSTRAPWRSALILGLVATVLAATGSWIPSLWGDEAASVMSAQRPLSSLFVMLTHVDAVHGSYYVFLHFWIDAFGASPFSVRVPPAIGVGFVVAGVVFIVRELGTTRLAIIAGIVCCVLPRVTYMGEETRAYAFSAAYAAWATWALVRLLRDRASSRRWWIFYGALMTCGCYAFLYFGLFVVVHALILLSARTPRAVLRRWAITVASVVVAVSPLLVFGFLERGQVAFLAGQETITFSSMTVGLWFSAPTFALVAWFLIVVAVVAFVWRRRRAAPSTGPSLTIVAVAWLVVPALVLVLGSIVKNDFTGRYMSFSAPAAGILMALGIETIARFVPRRVVVPTLVVATLAVVAVATPIYLAQRTPYAKNGSDWAEISSTIGAHARAGDAIVFDDGARPSRRPRLALHTYPAGFRGLRDVTLETPYQRSSTWYDRTYTVPQAEALGRFRGVTRVWLVEYVSGGKADTYGLADLENDGYAVQATYPTHSSRIIELIHGHS